LGAGRADNIEKMVNGSDVDNELTNDTINAESSTELDPSSSSYSYSRVNQRWEVGVRLSTSGSFESMSFVNNVWTSRGGTHVNLVTGQIVKSLEQSALKQGMKVSSSAIRNKLHVFVNCHIENPMFDGQTKDCLNSKAASFGSSCDLSDKFLKHIDQTCGVLESIYFDMEAKSRKAFISKSKPSKKHFLDIPKLDDAHRAGSKDALQCTLILTEGDSAKALAVSGLEVVGRELFGVLPLRGKVLRTMPPSLCSDAAAIGRCDDDGVDSMILSKNCIANR
jgi:DNA topoisomerase-2